MHEKQTKVPHFKRFNTSETKKHLMLRNKMFSTRYDTMLIQFRPETE